MAKKKKLYELTDEHRAQLKPWADRWTKIIMSTDAMTEADKSACIDAVYGLYDAAELKRPKHIVFVPSPLVGNVASGFAAAIWHLTHNSAATWAATWAATMAATRDATRDATWAATRDATRDATSAATWDATWAATRAATWDATWAATWAATSAATRDATRDATSAATRDATSAATWAATSAATRDATSAATWAATSDATWDATWAATRDATSAATRDATRAATRDATWVSKIATDLVGAEWARFLCDCVNSAMLMGDGGNHWGQELSWISFFRHVDAFKLEEHEAFAHYEAAAVHGSWRWMHPDFCIISDRPKTLKVDHLNRPHCADGPSHEWRDGWKLYHWKGLRIDDDLIERRHEMTAKDVLAISNAEHRRAAMEIYASVHGPGRFASDLGAVAVAEDVSHGRPRKLYRIGDDMFVHVVNGSLEPDGSRREFLLGASPGSKTPADAIAASYGRPAKKYREAVRT